MCRVGRAVSPQNFPRMRSDADMTGVGWGHICSCDFVDENASSFFFPVRNERAVTFTTTYYSLASLKSEVISSHVELGTPFVSINFGKNHAEFEDVWFGD